MATGGGSGGAPRHVPVSDRHRNSLDIHLRDRQTQGESLRLSSVELGDVSRMGRMTWRVLAIGYIVAV